VNVVPRRERIRRHPVKRERVATVLAEGSKRGTPELQPGAHLVAAIDGDTEKNDALHLVAKLSQVEGGGIARR
jgi:hypothetical protein